MIKGNCAQSVVPRCGEKFNSFGLLQCPYWSILKMWLLLLIGKIIAHFLKYVCFENCDGLFVQGFEEDRPKDSEKWSCVKRMHEVMGVVFGAMFGEERVNNSVDLLSRVLFGFSVGQISALVTVTHFCCNVLLQMLECYWTCSQGRRASLASFSRRTNTSSVLHALRAYVYDRYPA